MESGDYVFPMMESTWFSSIVYVACVAQNHELPRDFTGDRLSGLTLKNGRAGQLKYLA